MEKIGKTVNLFSLIIAQTIILSDVMYFDRPIFLFYRKMKLLLLTL